jgi:putative oxidoreductase
MHRQSVALLLMRLTFGGLMFVNHGLGKAQKLAAGGPYQWADPLGIGAGPSLFLATGAETVCAILLALGLFTRAAGLPLAFTMGVAAFVVHADDPLSKKEMALLYLAAYAAIVLLGPGRYALGQALKLPPEATWRGWLLR